ncbi:DUF7507 domain-containing protein [Demequina sp.]|uniref:DUF7507 domain-containing protein n=1 Tax=Demequina sp. TaxID=2050685 RepID=UPI003D0D2A69
MRGSITRAFARPRYAALVIVALLAGVLAPVALPVAPADAVAATAGAARFPQVQWISWGDNGETLAPNASGDIIATETITIGAHQIVVTCTIDNLARPRGTDQTANGTRPAQPGEPWLDAYASGTWRGDGFDELYNIGGTGTNNTLVAGVRNHHNANTITFDFSCGAELVVGSSRTTVPLAGLVMASAESSVNNGSFQEYIGATISSAGTWRILDRTRGTSCTQDNYAQRTSPTASTSRLVLQGAANTTCEDNTAAVLPNAMSVAFMDGVSSATNVTLAGRGNEAIALGVLLNLDFGDAPSSYGVAGAVSQSGFTGGTVPAYSGSGTGTGVFSSGFTLATQGQPTMRLGSAVDFEAASQFSATANGDDNTGTDDEDGVTLASSYTATPGSTVTVSGIQCSTSTSQAAYVAGWIDFNANGVFDAGEKSTTSPACPSGGGTVSLSFTAPSSAPALAVQPSFARFRIAPTTAELQATGYAGGGEVEDYPITMSWPEKPAIDVTKTRVGTVPTKAGDTVTWNVLITNTGNTPLSSVAVTDAFVGASAISACGFPTTLAVGASANCNVSHVMTQAEVNAGSVTNTASATGVSPKNVSATDSDTNTVTIVPAPDLTITKTPIAGTSPSHVGDPVQWTVTVTNSGNVTLTDVKATEQLSGATLPTTGCPLVAGVTLAPNASASCVVSYSATQADLDAGSVTNTVQATGKPPTGANVTKTTTSTVATTQSPALTVTKTPVSGVSPSHVGDPVQWTVTVTNSGNVTLTGVKAVEQLAGATLPSTGCSLVAGVTLAPAASASCVVSYSATQADLNAGSITNTVQATGNPPTGAAITKTATSTVTTTQSPALSVTKVKKSGTPTKAGDPVVWTVTVTNSGNVTLTNVTVTDALAGATVVTPCAFSSAIASMAPSASVSCDVSYSVTQANVDTGSVTNSATATGTPPTGPNVTATGSNTVAISPSAAIDVTKVKKSGTPTAAGDPVVWTVTVRNTGNVTLTNVTVTDALAGATLVTPCAFSSAIASLAPNATASCDVSYAVTQANVDAGSVTNSVSASGEPPTGANVTDSDSNSVTIAPAAAIDITKVKKSGTPSNAGDPVVWTLTVRNTGNVTLTNVTVTDALAGATFVTPCALSSAIASLAPNATATCDVSYAVTQANINAGSVTNSATATGTPPTGANVTDTDSSAVSIARTSGIDVTKVKKSGTPAKAGDPVVWTVTVRNTGNVTLSNVTVTDALAGATLVTPCAFSSPIASLAPGASASCDVSYAVTQANVDAGTVTNSASASGTPPTGPAATDSDSNTVTIAPAAAIDVTKVKKSGTPTKAGDPVVWTVTARNSGNVTLTNVNVTDSLLGASLVAPCPFSSTVASLAPGVSLSCDVSYSVTQANVNAGGVTNSASAVGTPPTGANVTDSDSNAVTIAPVATIDVTKVKKSGTPTKAGDPVVWTVTVTNTGNVTLTNVAVSDALSGATLVTPCAFSSAIASMAPGASVACDVNYSVTQANVNAGGVTNSATATGTPPTGANVSDTDSNTVTIASAASIGVTKVKKSGTPTKAGDPVVWTVTVTNTGNVTLTNVAVTDALAGATLVTPCGFSSPIASLAPAASASCDVTYAVTQANVNAGSVTNSATATGTPPSGPTVTGAGSNTVTIASAPAIDLTKVKKSGTPTKAGDPVVWTVTITNTGNVTLSNVTVTDALAGATLVTPCAFSSPIASLAPGASASCDVSYAVTQANVNAGGVTNSASVTGAPPTGANVTDSDSNVVTITRVAAIDVAKVKKSGTPTKAGDPVVWTVSVTNTGNVTLADVTVSDALLGATLVAPCPFSSTVASLAPGTTLTCDVSYAVTQANVNAGGVTNSATASGTTPTGGSVTDTDANTVSIAPAAAIDVTKVKKSGTPTKAGDPVVWTVSVTNTGNVTLTNVTVTDVLAGASFVSPCPFSAAIASLAPGVTLTCDVSYAVTQANVDAGSVANSASAVGTPPTGPNVSDSDANTVPIGATAGIDVTKVKKSGTPTKAGDPVVWTVTVRNTGALTLTNVTVSDALAGATLVTPCGFSSPIASLAPNASVSCDVSYAVTQANVNAGSVINSATATGTPPTGPAVTDTGSDTVTIAQSPALDVTKVKKSGTPTKAGDPVVWTVSVRNSGNVTLTNVTVTDALAGATFVSPCPFSSAVSSLAPGATLTCDVSYSVTQANVNAGGVTNSASAIGTPPTGPNVTDSESNTVTIAASAAIGLTKVKKSGTPAQAGDPVVWTVTVTNTGNVTLTNVTVTDALAGATLVTPCVFSSAIASLAPGASATCDVSYAVTQANVNAGGVTNSATASGTPPTGPAVTDTDANTVAIAQSAAIELTKVKKSGTPTNAGDPVVWTVTVTNTGNVTLTNVTVADALPGATLVAPCAFSTAIASLAPNASASCDVTYAVTQANVDTGGVTNSATATGVPPTGPNVTDTDSNTVTIAPTAHLDVTKVKKSGTPTKAGDTVVWTVTVANTGNVTLTNVTVTDALAGAALVTPCAFATPLASLAPAASVSCDVTYAVTQANVNAGGATNSASAVGTPPTGANVTDSDSNTVTIARSPAIDLTKVKKSGTPTKAGDPVVWTVTVTNTGNVTLTNVTVTDALAGAAIVTPCGFSSPISTLLPGGSVTCDVAFAVTQAHVNAGAVTNSASVVGTPPTGANVTDSDTSTVPIATAAAIDVTKVKKSGVPTKAGDPVVWTMTVSNTGTVTLTNVTVTDALAGAAFVSPCSFSSTIASLAPGASLSCDVSYAVTQANVNAGGVTNSATATGTPPTGANVTDTAADTVAITPAAGIDVTKAKKSGSPTKAGDPVVWTVTVTNTGNVTLSNVTVTDALSGATLVTPCDFSSPMAALAPNASVSCDVTYAVTQANVNAGGVTNSASATGAPPTGPIVTDSDSNVVPIGAAPAVDVTKVHKSGTPTKAGDPVVWTVTVRNSGNVTLTNVTVTDALAGATLVTPCGFSSPISSLAPNAAVSCDVTYAATQANVDAGSVTNSAAATGTPPTGANVTDSDANTVTITPTAAIDVTKVKKSGSPVNAGDTVVWTVTVRNTGTSTLTNVTVTDALAGATLVTPCGFSSPISSLAPNASVACDVTYAVTQANVNAGGVTNTATASGTPPTGPNVTDSDSHTVTIASQAAIDVTKVKKSGTPTKAGDPVEWTVTVTNTGNVALSNVTVTDALPGASFIAPCSFSSVIGSLAPSASLTCDVSYSVTQANVNAGGVTNSATATGTPPTGPAVSDTDSNAVTIAASPALEVTKVKKSGTPTKAGDPVVWTVTVTNTGNVTLTDVTVADALAGAALVSPCAFATPIASLAPSAAASCDVTYSVTQANVNAGSVTNAASAVGTAPTGPNVTDADSNTVTIEPSASIDVIKVKKSGTPTKAGDPVVWTVTVTNTGNVTLTDVTVTDALAGATIVTPCGFSSPIASLAPNAAVSCDVSYAVTQANVNAGGVTNSATATGTPPTGANVTDTGSHTVTIAADPSLDVTKVKKSGTPTKAGDPVVWTVTVTNTGNVTLTNVTVTDALAGATLVTPCGFSSPIASLAPNASVSCDVSYAVTQANVNAGTVTNSASASGTPPTGPAVTDSGSNTVTITSSAAIGITKVKKSGTPTKAGDPVVWTVTVTNTGTVTLSNVTVSDALAGATLVAPCAFSSAISSLAPGASATCDVSYSVTQANSNAGSVTNSATATGTPPTGPAVSDTDSNTVTIAPAAAVGITKVRKSGTPTKAGDPVVWTVTVTNTGNVTLTNVTVTDALAGATIVTPCDFSSPIASLAPGASAACDVSYSVTQANVNAGGVTNSATASGTPPTGPNVTDTATNTVTITAAAAIDVTKVKKSGSPAKAGDPVVWTVTVTNTGNVTLTDVTVADALAGATIVTPCAFSTPIASLAPNASVSCDVSYAVTQANVNAGGVTNSASATGTPPTGAHVTDSDSNTVTISPSASIDVTKVKKSGTPAKAGDPVVWTVTVTNTGNVTLTNVTVSDALAGASLVTPCAFSTAIASLAPNASASCDVNYAVTQANVNAGGVTNSASAVGSPPTGPNVTDSDSNTVTIAASPAIELTKVKKSGTPTKAGDSVVWTVSVTNTGNVTLTNVTVTDALAGATLVSPCTFATPIASLAPAATVTCDVTYAVTQANVNAGGVTNTASVVGMPPTGADVTDADSTTVTIAAAPAIDITKVKKSGTPAKAGDPVVWTVTVTNTGNVTLTNVTVADALAGAAFVSPCDFASPIASLAPAQTVTCDVTYSVTQANVNAGGVTNSATATGTPPTGAAVSDTDSNAVTITPAAGIDVTKVKKSGTPTKAGDPVVWTVTVTNTGNVTLSSVIVTDALIGASLVSPCPFATPIASLAPGASLTCDVTYAVTQTNVDAGAVTNSVSATGTPPTGPTVTDADANTVPIGVTPGIDVTKVRKSGAPTKAGDSVVWTVTVTNTGTVTLTNVSVTDALAGATLVTPCGFASPIATLAPSASVSCDVSYAVTQANVDAGAVTNSATATGTPPTGPVVTDTDSNTVTITPSASIDVTKVKKSGTPTKAGDPVVWTVTVTNTGSVTLANVTVTDALAGAAFVSPCPLSSTVASLAPGASLSCDVSYSVTQANVNAGGVTNSASATGTPPTGPNVSDSDANAVTITPAAAIDVVKVKKSGTPTKAGDPVVWTVSVTNTGNVTLTDVTVADALADAAFVSPCDFETPIASLAPAQTVTCDVTYSVTQANVNAGGVTNTATATGTPPTGPNVTDTSNNFVGIGAAAGISVTKVKKSGTPTKAGDPVVWTVTVTNTGNVSLANVVMTEGLAGVAIPVGCAFAAPIASLAPNASVSCDVSYAVTQANVNAGAVTNTVSAVGAPPTGPTVTDDDSNTVTIAGTSAIDVTKVKKSGTPAKAGDPVVWTVTVTNTGTVTLSNVTVTDALAGATFVTPCAFANPIASLAPNASASCDVTYAVTQANVNAGGVTNSATASGTPPTGPAVTDTATDSVTIASAPALEVTKVKKSGAPTKAGDPVVWTVTVANTGNVTLTNVAVTDALAGVVIDSACGFADPIPTLAPNASVTCDVSYAVTQANVNTGSVTNSASATGTPPTGANVTDSDSNAVTITPVAAIDITKTKKSGTPTKAGDAVVWTVTVTNTGTVTLTDVTVADALAGAAFVSPCGFADPISSLAPGATVTCDVTYEVTQANVNAGTVTNSATASGTPPTGPAVSEAASSTVPIGTSAGIELTKVKKSGTPTKAGDPVVWTVTIENTGTVTLTDVTVTDALAGAVFVSPCAFASAMPSLAPGATASCDVSYAVTQAKVNAGSVTNTASVTGTPPTGPNVTDSDSNTVTIAAAAALEVTKAKKSGSPAKAGDPVVWTVSVTNTGNVTLTDVTVTDALAGAAFVSPCDFETPIASLAPAASATCDVTYDVTQANVNAGSVTNSATATGTPPTGANVTDTDTNTVFIAAAPAIELTKVKKSGVPAATGDPVVWTITVKNTGNVTLTNVSVVDALPGVEVPADCGFASAIPALAPNESVACDVSYTVTQANVNNGEVTNSATATGTPPTGPAVTDTDSNTVTIARSAGIEVTKAKKSGTPTKAGDPVVWTVRVENTGNVALTNVTVTDALADASFESPCAFTGTIATLLPGASVACDVTYDVTQANVNAGGVTNSASVSGTPPTGPAITDTDSNTVTIAADPELTVTKVKKSGAPTKAGDVVEWTVTVENTGNVTLTNVTVTDALAGAAFVAPCDFATPLAELAPAETVSCDVTYAVTQANVEAGSVTNSATASGKPPVGDTVTDTDTNTVTITPEIPPIAADDDVDSTTGGTPITRASDEGVLGNDSGTGITVIGHTDPTPAQGSLTIAPDGGYTFTPVLGFHGVVVVTYTIEDEYDQTTSATLTITVGDDLPLVVTTQPRPMCVGDMPYLDWSLALPEGFPSQGATPLTVTFLNPDEDGDDYVVTGLPLTGSLLWPGASDETPKQWPGWERLENGTYVETDGNYAWTRAGVEVQFKVNPQVTITVAYPEASSVCANPPEPQSPPKPPTATHDDATTTGGVPITVDATHGVLSNDSGDEIKVTDYTQPDPAKGSIVLNPDGSFTFTPVPGFHGTVEIPYTIEDEDGDEANAVLTIVVTEDLPLVVKTRPHALCQADVPYLDWDLALPAGFPSQGANPLTITFVNPDPDGEDYVVTGLPLEGTMLWPGASADDPQQWPGWMQLEDGTYVETDGNFAWTRDGVEVIFKVNPEVTVIVQYPQATALCANPPAEDADPDVPDVPDHLSHTGATVMALIPWAAAFVIAGFFIMFVTRRRRDEEDAA